MKTKEDILSSKLPKKAGWSLPGRSYDLVLEAMQLYSDQQNKELLELLKRVYPYIKSVGIYYDQKLANLLKEIEQTLKP